MYTLYGKEDCSYCQRAKDLLDSKGIEYTYVDVRENDANLTEMMNRCQRVGFTPRIVPQIFTSEGNYVGGYTELHTKLTISG